MKIKIKIESDPTKVKRGHQPHRSGAGVHKDKREKRKQDRIRKECSYEG